MIKIYTRDYYRPAIEGPNGRFFLWKGRLVEVPWNPIRHITSSLRKLTARKPIKPRENSKTMYSVVPGTSMEVDSEV